MKLTIQQFNTSANYIKTHARPLEQKLLSFHFEGGSKEDAADELAKFQNDDGGIRPVYRARLSTGQFFSNGNDRWFTACQRIKPFSEPSCRSRSDELLT
ncbi:hypothetical protein QTG56_17275 [Rossellomorea sp. AcN35-11]|nr:hypothetical protein QTG56_17275 [Rossellomorea sp. AcN35-11]